MEALDALLHGLTIAAQPMNLLYALIGVLLGTAVGVLPGIGPALTVALLLPITFKLERAGACHRRDRLVPRRHARDARHRVLGAMAGGRRGQLRARGLFCADVRRLH